MAPAKTGLDMRGAAAGIGQYAQAAVAVGKNKLTGLARVVRDRKRLNLDSADLKRLVTVEQAHVRQSAQVAVARERLPGARRHPDRQLEFSRHCSYAIDMVGVFVGNYNRRQLVAFYTEPRQTVHRFL